MAKPGKHDCPNCERLDRRTKELEARVADLEGKLAKAQKTSATSSKPPSSDIVKPPKKQHKGKRGKRKRGAQAGHERHQRPPFSEEELDHAWEYRLDDCPCCHGKLKDLDKPPRSLQQIDLRVVPVVIEEHRGIAQWCEKCQRVHYGALPEELVRAGLVGPRLTAFVGFLKGPCHMSFSTIRKLFRDVLKVRVSRGLLAKVVRKVSISLKDPYEELLWLLPQQDVLNVDETGHKDQGKSLCATSHFN